MIKNNSGYCQCGCGEKTRLANITNSRCGHIKGQPMRYIQGHYARVQGTGSNSANWRGGKHLSGYGYIYIWKPNHPKTNSRGYVLEHILIAEEVLGKPLPEGAIVHHINENRSGNRKENLVICENENYHKLLHVRLRALKACGNPNWKKCKHCKEYDDPENLCINGLETPYHKKCKREYDKLRYLSIKKEIQCHTNPIQ